MVLLYPSLILLTYNKDWSSLASDAIKSFQNFLFKAYCSNDLQCLNDKLILLEIANDMDDTTKEKTIMKWDIFWKEINSEVEKN